MSVNDDKFCCSELVPITLYYINVRAAILLSDFFLFFKDVRPERATAVDGYAMQNRLSRQKGALELHALAIFKRNYSLCRQLC